MKRTALLFGALALAAANTANAQLAMQMSNGWTFTFSGNVNAFYIYNSTKSGGTTVGKNSGIGTGLLPAFATFEAKGKEGNTDLSVFFGFAPQVSSGDGLASFFGTDAAGAQIDTRQIYLTAGGSWGSILAGKQIGLYQRSNIVEDMTIFGVGPGGGNRGTSLGRIAYGYEYTDFRPQFTYSSPGGKQTSFSVGLFSPLAYASYTTLELPRLEADFNWKNTGSTSIMVDVSGFVQSVKNGVTGTTNSITPVGGAATVKVGVNVVSLVGSGYYTKGGCSVFMGNSIAGGSPTGCDGISNNPDAGGKFNTRTGYGWYGQLVVAPKDSKVSFGASYGGNYLKPNTEDKVLLVPNFRRNAIIGEITYKWTKSLRFVAEFDHFDSHSGGVKGPSTNQGAVGFMLFY